MSNQRPTAVSPFSWLLVKSFIMLHVRLCGCSVAPNLNPAGKAALVVTPCAKRISVVNFNDMQLCSDGVPPPELQTKVREDFKSKRGPLLGLDVQL